jgi:hypothetical protein
MSRIDDINALIGRADKLLPQMESDYENTLHDQTISSELKIDIKDLVGHLRSILDYLAHDIRDKHCPTANSNNNLYFPIRSDRASFDNYINSAYPDLTVNCSDIYDFLESIQSYHGNGNEWLTQFNKLNNENKHEQLVEQTRTESKRVNVDIQGGGSVNWDPSAVKFRSGVFIGRVPVNPNTQMPQQSSTQTVTVTTWVDFKFDGINVSALGLLKESVSRIKEIVTEVNKNL